MEAGRRHLRLSRNAPEKPGDPVLKGKTRFFPNLYKPRGGLVLGRGFCANKTYHITGYEKKGGGPW